MKSVFAELKKMKEKELEQNKKIWAKEVVSEKNPNIAAIIEKKEKAKDEKVISAIQYYNVLKCSTDWSINRQVEKICNQRKEALH